MIVAVTAFILLLAVYLSNLKSNKKSIQDQYNIKKSDQKYFLNPSPTSFLTPTVKDQIIPELNYPESGWKTYKSNWYSLSIPETWSFINETSYSDMSGDTSLYIFPTDLRNIEECKDSIYEWNNDNSTEADLIIGGALAKEYEDCLGIESCTREIILFIQKNGTIYRLDFDTHTNAPIAKTNRELYKKIISYLKIS